jgi:hypothetical protein
MRKSKTMWFALLLVIFGALEAGFPYLESVIAQQYYGVLLVAIGVIVAILRFITTKPIK